MAMLGQDDEFFGDDDSVGNQAQELASGLAAAEASAMNDRHRKLGFHEAFEKSEETNLQEGFEKGYQESFEIAKRIGSQIGELVMIERLLENNFVPFSAGMSGKRGDASTIPISLQVAKEVRDVLTDPSTPTKDLKSIESAIFKMDTKAS